MIIATKKLCETTPISAYQNARFYAEKPLQYDNAEVLNENQELFVEAELLNDKTEHVFLNEFSNFINNKKPDLVLEFIPVAPWPEKGVFQTIHPGSGNDVILHKAVYVFFKGQDIWILGPEKVSSF